jgi:hypothetical protein
MKEVKEMNPKGAERREILKNAGKFLIPTLITFHVSELSVAASGEFGSPLGSPFSQ